MNQAEVLLLALRIWGSIGAVVAVIFLSFGMDRIDEDARGAYVFRPLLIPGILVIWPLVLWRWYLYESGSEIPGRRYAPPRKAHFSIGLILPVGIVLIILIGWTLRQTWPADIAPVQLSQPEGVSQ